MNTWHIFVFSFNRGVFLKNCLDSIKKCGANIDVTVIDDNSDDPITNEILNSVQSNFGFEVVKANKDNLLEKRLGGLYGNMNMALDISQTKNKKYMLFIQDDMQFVRKVVSSDLNNIEKVFDDFNDIQQVQSCFLKNLQVDHYKEHLTHLKENKCYISNNSVHDLSAFSDVGVFYVPRFENNNGVFVSGERNNNKISFQNNVKLAYLEQPFMMWLPYAKSYQGKNISLKTKVIEKIAQCDFYPIEIMDDTSHKIMIDNKEQKLPIAEYWLKVDKLKGYPTWSFSAGVINLYARGGFRRKIAKSLWKI
jgi:hypothetical protein